MSDDPAQSAEPGPCFETALEELETIVHELEEGQLGLAEALSSYEKGIGLLKHCYGLLENTQRRIEVLTGIDASGSPITEPFHEPAAATLEEKAQLRSQRRVKTTEPRKRVNPENMDDLGGLF
jgi:exodeoxyribonuclease VII small subunit